MSDGLAHLLRLSPEDRARALARLRSLKPSAASPLGPAPRSLTRAREGGETVASFTQEQFWFLHQLEPGSPTYNIPFSFRIDGPLDVDALAATLAEISRRHEVLRARIAIVGERLVQRIAAQPARLELEDLGDLKTAARDEALRRIARQTVRTLFDLEAGPLLRTVLVRLGACEHVLLWVAHHAFADGASLAVLAREISELYEPLRSGELHPLPELSVQFADYAAWQRDDLGGARRTQLVAFWRDRLETAQALELATDFRRPQSQTFDGATQWFRVAPSPTAALRTLSQRNGLTLFMTLLAAYQLLLARHSGQDDIVVGTPVSGRGLPGTEALIGPFLNTIAMRTDLSGDPTCEELLRRVREIALDAFAHQDLPFGVLVEELRQRRDPQRNPAYQAMFGFGNVPISARELRLAPGLTMVAEGIPNETARVDLEIVVEEEDDGLVGRLEYNTQLFAEHTARQLADRYVTLLVSMAADPDARISEIELLSPADRALQASVNDTAASYPRDTTIHALIAEQVRRAPDAVAVECGVTQLTYGELDRRANRLAHLLRARGVEPEQPVGLCVSRSVDLLVAVLGVLKSGGAYVPLDPAYPATRQEFILTDSEARVLVSSPDIELPPAVNGIDAIRLGDPALDSMPDEAPAEAGSASSVAYVIYTSGSTGTPKGVVIEHRSVVNLLLGLRDTIGLRPDDVLASLASVSFDMAVPELLLPLCVGARVVIGSCTEAVDGERIVELLGDHKVDILQATPTQWRLVLQAGLRQGRLRMALCTAEPLPAALGAEMCRRIPSVWNLYGPTETTVFSTAHELRGGGDGPPPIGRPLPNTTVHVLDGAGRTMPPGAVGELFIGGAGVARGYLHRPELTARRFLAGGGRARLYRTGDRVRQLPDGTLQCLGRTDYQIKLRGLRIEPGEIETVIENHVDVRRAVVMLPRSRGYDDRLVAYVDAPAEALSATELRCFVATTLPRWMIPSHFVFLDGLPVTPNGKVDRCALPDIAGGDLPARHGYVAPRSPTERQLAQLCEEVLRCGRVGVFDDFFVIGGHSLLAAQVVARIQDRLDVTLTVDAIFERPTVADLAVAVDQRRAARADPDQLARVLRHVEALSDAAACAAFGELQVDDVHAEASSSGPPPAVTGQ